MHRPTSPHETSVLRSLWFRGLVLVVYLIGVNLLAGWLAVTLRYESLWNVNVGFAEYALPLPMSWGLAHLPSMMVCGAALFLLPTWSNKGVIRFRIACLAVFSLLLLEGGRQIPFLLFPKVDVAVALLCSFVLVPPTRRENPRQLAALSLVAAAVGIYLVVIAYGAWTHRTPSLTVTQYADGAFVLTSIEVYNDYRKSLVFQAELKEYLPEEQACDEAQLLAEGVMRDYPFDADYDKRIEVVYNPVDVPADFQPYPLGEIDLTARDKAGRFACYLRYK